MSGTPTAVGIDVGGTKLVATLVDDHGEPLKRARRRSPVADPDRLIDTLAGLVAELDAGRLPVGVGIAGIVDRDGTLRYSPNLKIRDVAVGDLLQQRLGTPVLVKNDATVALYGEYLAGAGRGAEHLVMFTLGTGVGGAVLIQGNVIDGKNGFAGELGHVIVVEGGRPCPCGNRGCLEAYASGTAIENRAVQRLDEGGESTLRELAPDDLVGRAITQAANDGDHLAQELLTEAGTWLGIGMASVVNVLDTERIVVGGGASTNSDRWILPAAETTMQERIIGADHRPAPVIVLAELGDDAGMIGAALLAAEIAA